MITPRFIYCPRTGQKFLPGAGPREDSIPWIRYGNGSCHIWSEMVISFSTGSVPYGAGAVRSTLRVLFAELAIRIRGIAWDERGVVFLAWSESRNPLAMDKPKTSQQIYDLLMGVLGEGVRSGSYWELIRTFINTRNPDTIRAILGDLQIFELMGDVSPTFSFENIGDDRVEVRITGPGDAVLDRQYAPQTIPASWADGARYGGRIDIAPEGDVAP